MALTNDIRRSLADRVERRVAGEGIPRRSVDSAVGRVVDALLAASRGTPGSVPERATEDSRSGPRGGEAAHVVCAIASVSAPDLASRVRGALAQVGVTAAQMGTASAGRHTVVAVRVAAADRQAVERAAAALSLPISIIDTSRPEPRQ